MSYHFSVRCTFFYGFIYIDPYEGGLQMSEHSCRERIRQIAQHRIKFHSQWLEPSTRRHWLMRLLNNLKRIYINQDDFDRPLTTCDLLVILNTRAPEGGRVRDSLHLQPKPHHPPINIPQLPPD